MTEAWHSSDDHPHTAFGLPQSDNELSDSVLCARIRRHRPDSPAGRAAFGELYARHQLPALHFALRLNRDRSRAEDAVAEAFAKIWRAWGQGGGPDESFKPYLMAAVRSESYRRTATTRATTTVEPDVLAFLADSEPGDHAAEVAERDQLGRAFKALPDTWQKAPTLIDIDGTPTAEAAEAMGLSPNSFSSLLRRAREGLRVAYLQEHVEPSPPECAEHSSELARFVRHQLSPKRSEALEAHLAQCSHCSGQSFRLRSLNTTFQAWITPAALAAALIEIGHFPEGASVLAAGSSTTAFGTTAGTPGGSTSGLATGGGTAANTTGVAAGASALKVTIASIAATAAIAAGAVSIIDFESDPAQQPANAAETSSASAPSPRTSLPTSSSQATVPGSGSEGPSSGSEGPSSEKQSSGKPHEETEPEHSAPASEGRTPAAHEDGQTPEAQAKTRTPDDQGHAPVPDDHDRAEDEADEQESPEAEPESPSPERTDDTAAPTPSAVPTTASDPSPTPTSTDVDVPEPTSTSSSPPEPDSDAGAESDGASDADGSDSSDSADASDGGGDDYGSHCHDFGWWVLCH